MTVDPQLIPAVTISAAPAGPILIGATKTFTATVTNGGTPTYQWMLDGVAIPGATDATYAASNFSNGDSVWCMVVSGGTCGGNTSISNVVGVTVINNAGVASPALSGRELDVIPNPARDIVTITNAKGMKLTIYDVAGKVVYQASIVSNSQQIDVKDLANAVYVLRFVDAEGIVTTKRLVKE